MSNKVIPLSTPKPRASKLGHVPAGESSPRCALVVKQRQAGSLSLEWRAVEDLPRLTLVGDGAPTTTILFIEDDSISDGEYGHQPDI